MTKTIFITGASSGIGKATAKYFAGKGWNVIATMRKPENEKELIHLANITVLPMDVTNLEQIRETTQKALALGDIDVVFNNAGYPLLGVLESITDEQVVDQMETNFLGVVRVTQAFIPYFRKKGSGLFITTSSSAGLMGFPVSSMYDASKWAIEGWSESLSYELSEVGIGIKMIEPGMVATEGIDRIIFVKHPAYTALVDKFAAVLAPNENFSTPEYIAEVVYGAAGSIRKLFIMEHRNKLRVFHTITEMQRIFGLPLPLHPLISIVDYSKAEITPEMLALPFVMDFYNITYNEFQGCRMKYGQTIYDFEEGGMFFTSPGQPLTAIGSAESKLGFTLLIHPDFFRNYPLDLKIKRYVFFSYSLNESLHLSGKEKSIISAIGKSIAEELETAIDDISQDVLVSQIELLLSYSQRFYKRQFITRKPLNSALLEKLDTILDNYLNDKTALMNGLPTVQYVADQLNISPKYLGDILRSLTGHNTQQHIHIRLIEKAKQILTISDLTISEIAF